MPGDLRPISPRGSLGHRQANDEAEGAAPPQRLGLEEACTVRIWSQDACSGAPLVVGGRASAFRFSGRYGVSGVGILLLGHEVSGTDWQILGRAMLSITTMVPVWQC